MPKPSKPIRSVAFVSLGCPKNLVDSERMLGLLAQDGLAITPDAGAADVIVINTCGFLEASKDESLKEIRDAIALKKAGKVKRGVGAGGLVPRRRTKRAPGAPREARRDESLKGIRGASALKKAGKVKRVVVAGCLVQRHKTKLLNDVPEVDRPVGVFDREHIVEAVRGKENPRQEHGHFLGKYHDLSQRLSAELKGLRAESGGTGTESGRASGRG